MKIISLTQYLFITLLITIIMVLVYAAVQQSYRSAANDPQIQIAEDIASGIEAGDSMEDIISPGKIDIEKSLAPVVTLYNAAGTPLRSSGFLHNEMLRLPPGVFAFTKKNGEYRVTWQPANHVRMAMVLVHVNHSLIQFVGAGRSLREIEEREGNLRKMVFIAWFISILTVLLYGGIAYHNHQTNKSR